MQFQANWGLLIALYLFLAGISAGAYISAFVSKLKTGSDNITTRVGVLIAFPCLILSLLFLFLDLGKSFNFMYAFLRPFSSVIAAGTWILTFFFIVSLIQWLSYFKNKKLSIFTENIIWGFGFVSAVLTAFYTGVLLWEMQGVPFWNSILLPFLFLASAISTGIATVVIIILIFVSKKQDIRQEYSVLKFLSQIDLWAIGIEACILAIYLAFNILSSKPAAVTSVYNLITGSLSLPFWSLVILIGLIGSFYFDWKTVKIKELSPSFILNNILASFCLLIGGFMLRYLVLAAGTLGTLANLY